MLTMAIWTTEAVADRLEEAGVLKRLTSAATLTGRNGFYPLLHFLQNDLPDTLTRSMITQLIKKIDEFASEQEEALSSRSVKKEEQPSFIVQKATEAGILLEKGIMWFLSRHEGLQNAALKVGVTGYDIRDEKFADTAELDCIDKAQIACYITGRLASEAVETVSNYLSLTYARCKADKLRKNGKKLSATERIVLVGDALKIMTYDTIELIPSSKEEIKEHLKNNKNAYVDFLVLPGAIYAAYKLRNR